MKVSLVFLTNNITHICVQFMLMISLVKTHNHVFKMQNYTLLLFAT